METIKITIITGILILIASWALPTLAFADMSEYPAFTTPDRQQLSNQNAQMRGQIRDLQYQANQVDQGYNSTIQRDYRNLQNQNQQMQDRMNRLQNQIQLQNSLRQQRYP